MQKFFLFSCLLFISSFVHAARFIELGQLNGEMLFPTAISNGGTVVTGIANVDNLSAHDAFAWSVTGIQRIALPFNSTIINGPRLSNNGATIVGSYFGSFGNSFGNGGFIQTATSGLVVIPPIDEIAFFDVSADGHSFVAFESGRDSIRMTPNGTDILTEAGRSVFMNSISADGSTVVGFDRFKGTAIMWTQASGFIELGLPVNNEQFFPIAPFSAASDVSADGSVIIGSFRSEIGSELQPFIWTEDELLILDIFSDTVGVSDDGRVVLLGDSNEIPGSKGAFLWTKEGGIQTLESILAGKDIDLSLLGLTATALSPDGNWITVMGEDLITNTTKTYLVNISSVPIPGAFWLFASGLLALIAKKKFFL